MSVSKIVPVVSTSSSGSFDTSIYFQTTNISNPVVAVPTTMSVGRWQVNVTTTGTFVAIRVEFYNSSGSVITSVLASTANTNYDAYLTSTPASVAAVATTGSPTGTFTIQLTKISGILSTKTVTLETITTSGSYDITGQSALVGVVGGGGGGGDGAGGGTNQSASSGGGGGAGYLTKVYYPVVSGAINLTVGAGGTNNSAGGTTTFGNISANGGGGGSGTTGGVGSSTGGAGVPTTYSGTGGAGTADGANTGISLAPIKPPGAAGTAGGVAGGVYASGGGGNVFQTGGQVNLGRYWYGGQAGGGGGGAVAANANLGGSGGIIVLRWT